MAMHMNADPVTSVRAYCSQIATHNLIYAPFGVDYPTQSVAEIGMYGEPRLARDAGLPARLTIGSSNTSYD